MRIKRAKTEFTEAGLPHNRKEVFFDCLQMRFGTLLKCGAIMLLCFLPYLLVKYIADISINEIARGLTANEITEAQATALSNSYSIIFSLIYMLCMTIVAVGLAGVMRIIRNLIWGEGIFFRQDFFKGVRIYGGKFVIVFALGGLVNALNTYIGTFSSATEVVLYLPKIFSALFLLPACLYTIAQIIFYNDKLTRLFSNGIRFAVATFPITLLFTALLLAPWLMDAFSIPALLKYGLAILLVFFISPMYCMAWLLCCCHNFDRFINKETYPEIYDKGVYRLEKEETNDKE